MAADQNTTLSIPDAIALAARNFEAGETRACLYLCEKVIAQAPRHAMGHHLIALVRHRHGERDTVLHHLDLALAHAPGDPMIIANSVEILRSLGETQRAIDLGTEARSRGIDTPALRANLALAHYDAGARGTAKKLQLDVIAEAPDHVAALNNLGSIARDEGDLEGAIGWYRRVLAVASAHLESRQNLATVLIEADRLGEARAEIDQILAAHPDNAEALRSRGRIHLAEARLDAAETDFRAAIARNPQDMRSFLVLSQVLLDKNHPDLALAEAEKAVDLSPDNPLSLHQKGLCLANLHDASAAQTCYTAALAVDPGFAPSLLGRGYLHLELGETDAARQDFKAARDAGKDRMSALIALSRIDRVTEPQSEVLRELTQIADADAMAPLKRVSLHFALGDIHDGLGATDDAFHHYSLGAAQKRALIDYDAAAQEARIDTIIDTFDATFIERLREFADPSARPIFVLGMPRSGTTLTESILAAHARVHGAGELHDLQKLFDIDAICAQPGFPRNLANLSADNIKRRVATYLRRLDQLAPSAPRVTDKMPANFLALGLIHALLPNAKIVHVTRDPMDTCLSCFTRLFERSQLHSYDLDELGRYYLGHRRLMDHWTRVLPDAAFRTQSYEALVAEPEQQARDLVAYCGLDWDPACLDFHATRRRVRTASIVQVRQPIYSGSVGKWRRYRAHLGPLERLVGHLSD